MKTNGGPAFPGVDEVGDPYRGMSLRDYFAAKSMQTFLIGAVLPPGFDAKAQFKMLGDRAYEVADAMLKAREA